jgi:transcription-repair coupling factor (superfamily II helicase)
MYMQVTPASPQDIRRIDLTLSPSIGLHAVRLLEQVRGAGPGGVVYVAEGERRAAQLAQVLKGLAPDLDVYLLPPWDCLPYDSASPSRHIMGQRASVLRRMSEPGVAPRVLITSPAALVQRVPPRNIWKKASFSLNAGEAFSQDVLEAYLHRAGYLLDERVDEPGEAAIRGQVIDVFPANSLCPFRAEHDGQSIIAIRSYDPVSQRTEAEFRSLVLDPASEVVFDEPLKSDPPEERVAGMEHCLPEFYTQLETVFNYWPDAAVTIEKKADERRLVVLEQIADAYESRTRLHMNNSGGAVAGHAISPERLFIEDREWHDLLALRRLTIIRSMLEDDTEGSVVPRFVSAPKPARALADFVQVQKKAGRKVVLIAANQQDLSILGRRMQPFQAAPKKVAGWGEVLDGSPEGWFMMRADLKGGFIDERDGIAVITASDVLGSRAGSDFPRDVSFSAASFMDAGFQIGDVVIHFEHGIGVLEGIETVSAGDASAGDAVRLRYAGDARLMLPATEMGRIWRYGSASDTLTLDKLNGGAWPARRERIVTELQEAARRLTDMVTARKSVKLEPLVPPSRDYERFVARFPFAETADQLRAIEDVLIDLAAGRPMDRLVCGDVGFGKTEVALRAAAAAALAGKQVAVVAPTTVLARQHLRTFQRRFAGLGIEVVHLSRLVKPAEARVVKKGLADGSIRVVVATHALTGKGVAFKDLGLLIIDEEQRFGAAQKEKLRSMAAGGHVLTLTATPIPRTLQAALVGLQELSIIATPPARRQPIRTFLTPFDPATVREALMRERRRGGQSFVVCSRVEDIEPMQEQLARLVPELEILVAHGQMPPAETDDVMVRFADGEGDVLLATNIIESGLDVPRANTMLVWRADRFGLAQLHQLRGRVGRGRIRGTTYLLTEVGQILPKPTEKRLRTLEALDRLGAGFAISSQDLDMRGAGSLLGEEQAGHIKLIGAELYQHMLKRILHGELPEDDWRPELNLGLSGLIPEDYVNEPEVRINLYARLARLDPSETIEDLSAEIEDRFGPMPKPVLDLLDLMNLKRLCLHFGVARIDAGPQAIALAFRPGAADKLPLKQVIDEAHGETRWSGERLILARSAEQADERRKLILQLLGRFD